MTIEAVTHISDLNQALPASGDDPSEGDDHIRNIKKALVTDFANITGPVTATQTQLNNISLIQIATATASGVATVDFTSGFTSAYDEYELHIVNAIPATNSVQAKLLTTLDGSTWDVANYSSGLLDTGSTATTSTAAIVLSSAVISNVAGSAGICAVIKIFAPSGVAAIKSFTVQATYSGSATTGVFAFGGAVRATTSAVTGLRFLFSAGNVTSGLFKLYGVKK